MICFVKAKPIRSNWLPVIHSFVITLGFALVPDASGATKTWNTTTGTLSASTSWSPSGTPVTTDETLFDGTVTPADTIGTAAGNNLSFGNLIWNNDSSSTLRISSTSTVSTQLRLTGGGGSAAAIAAGGASGDLLVMGTNATNNTLTISDENPQGGVSLRLRLDASGNFNVVNSSATLSIQTILSETGGAQSLTKTGAGTLLLGRSSTYSGATLVSSGTLLVNGALANSSSVTVSSLASLGGNGSITNSLTVDGGAFLQPGATAASGTIGTLATGTLTLNGSYLATITANGVSDFLNITGNANFAGIIAPVLFGYSPVIDDAFNLANWTGSFSGTPTFDYSEAILTDGLVWDSSTFASDGTLRVIAIPEPASALLSSLGLLALLRRRRI